MVTQRRTLVRSPSRQPLMDCRVKPGNDTTVGLAAVITAPVPSKHSSRRDSSAPSKQAQGQRLYPSSSLTCVRERSAGWRTLGAPLREVPRAFAIGPLAFRRSTVAIYRDTLARVSIGRCGTYPSLKPRCLGPSPDRALPLKAAPSSGTDDGIAPWGVVTSHACRRHTSLRPPSVPRRRPQ